MKKKYLSLSACSLLAAFTFIGCGSSSSSDNNTPTTTTSTGTLQLNPYLANIDYTCGSIVGTTTSEGKFTYEDNGTCTFVIGGKSLTATPSSNLTIAQLANQNEGVSSEVLSAYIIAKMSQKTGITYDINNLPETFELPDDIEGSRTNPLVFDTFDNLKAKLGTDSIVSKIDNIKFDVANRFAKKVSLSFQELATPITNEEQLTQQVSSKAYVNGEAQNISYTEIMKTTMTGNSEILGQSKDYLDNPITFGDGSPYICNGTNAGEGSGMDFTSLHNVDGKLFAISQFECALGSMYMVELNQDTSTGKLTPKTDTLKYISQKAGFGGFVHCAGQKTPWNSHLSSEEYEPDAKSPDGNSYYTELAKYWGEKSYSAYYYGWTPEVKIENNEPVYSKHYAMGRFSHELAYVMPDNKTVYLSDDGTNVGLFMFVADVEKDLSSGTLYAAKWNQTSEAGVGTGSADLTWINLGHATNDEIKNILDPDGDLTTNDAPTFADIFDSVSATNGTCDSGFTSINTSAGQECLKIKSGMEKAASRLEVRRYAALKGATTEFNKEEGITFDKNAGKLYVSISDARKGMEDNSSYDVGGNNDIKIAANKCGAVYSLDVSTSEVKDTSNTAIASTYVVKNMQGIVAGIPTSYDSSSAYAGNSCDVNAIASPDNLSFLENSNTLVIGEDTSYHKNNVVWTYNTKTTELTKTFTTPLGAETTSAFWFPNLANGFSYLGVVTQHPDLNTTDGGESAYGYVGPFKNLTDLKDSTPQVFKNGASLPYTVLRNDLTDGLGNSFEIRNGGYGSAMSADPADANSFYAITDRGPNADFTGAEGKGKKFPLPDYTPRIGHFKVTSTGEVVKTKEILLKDRDGNNITGLPNTSALGGTGEIPYDINGNVIVDSKGNMRLDDYGLDSEGLAVLKDGTFWISDEYGPHIVHYDATGKEIERINPFASDSRNKYTLPAEFANRRANRGMEGLAITPDQKTLVGIMQSTMYNPSSSVKNLDITRIVAVNLEDGTVKQYLYKQEKKQNANSELVAIDNDTFLVLERDENFLQDSGVENTQKNVYKIKLSSGTELENVTLGTNMVQDATLGLTIDGSTLEEYVLANGWSGLESKGIKPVEKILVLDMVAKTNYPHDKMEGLWLINNSTLGVLNDDDFAVTATDGILEQKYLDTNKSVIDSNVLYIINGLDLSAN
ncbi:MAG: esterase-like activity of phytase family protein [Arcobacter sp.]|jgi:secreted PhoX family phosphatase|uniref:esterase-like activity of phytase family protein n=1 Tax=Arcobacter sp. TaxID=1872629 RepID=UPI002A75A9D3|nr:esterase-like activity of phytase family protein [Arcobacter sp.]MDY3199782.1 esterase-like activity of phytase family protein [Arcobacter sp.]